MKRYLPSFDEYISEHLNENKVTEINPNLVGRLQGSLGIVKDNSSMVHYQPYFYDKLVDLFMKQYKISGKAQGAMIDGNNHIIRFDINQFKNSLFSDIFEFANQESSSDIILKVPSKGLLKLELGANESKTNDMKFHPESPLETWDIPEIHFTDKNNDVSRMDNTMIRKMGQNDAEMIAKKYFKKR